MPVSESSVLEEAVSDSLPAGTGSRSEDVFDSTDVLNRWQITSSGTTSVEAGVPAVKYALGSGQSLSMVSRVAPVVTRLNAEAVWQIRLRMDDADPKLMVGLMASGSTESSVATGIWLEKAASGTALKLKRTYATNSAEVVLARTWPTASFVDVALKLLCWPGGLEAILELDGNKEGSLLIPGMQTGVVLLPTIFDTAESNIWFSQAALRCS